MRAQFLLRSTRLATILAFQLGNFLGKTLVGSSEGGISSSEQFISLHPSTQLSLNQPYTSTKYVASQNNSSSGCTGVQNITGRRQKGSGTYIHLNGKQIEPNATVQQSCAEDDFSGLRVTTGLVVRCSHTLTHPSFHPDLKINAKN